MEYEGDLYGEVFGKYFSVGITTKDVDAIKEKADLFDALKNAIIKSLTHNEQIADKPYLAQNGGKAYTRRELAQEIENNTDFGISTLKTLVLGTVSILNEQNIK